MYEKLVFLFLTYLPNLKRFSEQFFFDVLPVKKNHNT